MKRTLTTALVLAAVAFPAATSASSSTAASLSLLQRQPLQVRGLHFKARERVALTATTQKEHASIVVRTTRRGQFVARFSNFVTNSCAAIVIKAVGGRGDSAKLVVQAPPPANIPCPM